MALKGRRREAGLTRRREAGLTLVEMLIALALLAIVLLGIAPLFIASVKSNYSANEYTSIHNLARDRLEQLMNLPFNDAQLQPGVYTNDLPQYLPAPVPPTPASVRNPLAVAASRISRPVARRAMSSSISGSSLNSSMIATRPR